MIANISMMIANISNIEGHLYIEDTKDGVKDIEDTK